MGAAASSAGPSRFAAAAAAAGAAVYRGSTARRAASSVPEHAYAAIIADADRLLKGEWEMLGVVRTDMTQPDWFY